MNYDFGFMQAVAEMQALDHPDGRQRGECEKMHKTLQQRMQMGLTPAARDDAVRQITREEFAHAHGQHYSSLINAEISWWTSTAGHLLDTVIYDRVDSDYSFVLPGRDERGQFRAINIDASIATQDEAQRDLHAAMQRAIADCIGRAVPRGSAAHPDAGKPFGP
jgi:hypothetical protein